MNHRPRGHADLMIKQDILFSCRTFARGNQQEYSSKTLKDSIVKRILVFKR